MMETELTPVMSVYMIIMDRLGCKLEQILMAKRQMIKVVFQFLYLLTDQGWLLDQKKIKKTDLTPVMSVFMIIPLQELVLGLKLEEILTRKRQVTIADI